MFNHGYMLLFRRHMLYIHRCTHQNPNMYALQCNWKQYNGHTVSCQKLYALQSRTSRQITDTPMERMRGQWTLPFSIGPVTTWACPLPTPSTLIDRRIVQTHKWLFQSCADLSTWPPPPSPSPSTAYTTHFDIWHWATVDEGKDSLYTLLFSLFFSELDRFRASSDTRHVFLFNLQSMH